MIKYIIKDVTTVDAGVVVHGVNCRGVMGAGVAKAIRNKWPTVYDQYVECCNKWKQYDPSMLLGTILPIEISNDLIVVNLFSQVDFGSDGKKYANANAILSGLKAITEHIRHEQLNGKNRDVYIPKIGCGLGGLSWETEVLPIVEYVIDQHKQVTYAPINFFVCDI